MTEASLPKKSAISYIDPNLLKEFNAICRREDTSRTAKIEDWIQHCVQAHKLGNPQLLMSNYIETDEPLPMRVLCPYLDEALTSGEVYCKRKGLWIKSISVTVVGLIVCVSGKRSPKNGEP